jgi:hypothetical protein
VELTDFAYYARQRIRLGETHFVCEECFPFPVDNLEELARKNLKSGVQYFWEDNDLKMTLGAAVIIIRSIHNSSYKNSNLTDSDRALLRSWIGAISELIREQGRKCVS